MKNDALISIGEMAKMYEITTQTLRYYDKIGLLHPAIINPETGYRYYALRQCLILDVILYLKYIGTPLEEIVHLIQNGQDSVEHLREILRNNQQAVAEKIKALEQTGRMIDIKLAQLEQMEQVKGFGEVYHKTLPARQGLCVYAEEPSYTSEHPDYRENLRTHDVHYAARILTAIVERSDYANIECEWGFFGSSANTLQKDVLPKYNGYFSITNNPALDRQFPQYAFQIPAGEYLCTTYRGQMFANAQAHNLLYDYVTENHIALEGFFYDEPLYSGYLTPNRDDYIMEIKFLIKSHD